MKPDGDVGLVQIDIEPSEINRSRLADVALLGDARLILEQLTAASKPGLDQSLLKPNEQRMAEIQSLKARWDEVSAPLLDADSVPINPFRVTAELIKLVDLPGR